jgi:hypothetical protein
MRCHPFSGCSLSRRETESRTSGSERIWIIFAQEPFSIELRREDMGLGEVLLWADLTY